MKAPERTYQTPAVGPRNLNYSMLPPGKLPDWLQEHHSAVTIFNYSMRPMGTQPETAEYIQKKESAPQALVIQPLVQCHAATETTNMESVLPAPESISMAITSAPVPAKKVENMPATNENTLSVEELVDLDKSEELQPMESNLIDQLNITQEKTEIEVDISENRNEPVINWQPPSPPIIQLVPQVAPPNLAEIPQSAELTRRPEYTPNRDQPTHNSFADWIFNNNTTSIIIVAVIIIISIVTI